MDSCPPVGRHRQWMSHPKKKKKHRYSFLRRQSQQPRSRPHINSDCQGQYKVPSSSYSKGLQHHLGLVVVGAGSEGPKCSETTLTCCNIIMSIVSVIVEWPLHPHRCSLLLHQNPAPAGLGQEGRGRGCLSCGEGVAGRDSPHHRHVAWGPRFCTCRVLAPPSHAPEQSISTMSLGTSTNW